MPGNPAPATLTTPAIYAGSQATMYPTPGTSTSTDSSSGNSSDAAVSEISPTVSTTISNALSNAGDSGLSSNPSYNMALQAALAQFTSPYIAQLKQQFGNPQAVAASLDAGLSADHLTPAETAAITSANKGMANSLAALPGAVSKDAANLIPGSIDTETIGALSSAMKYYLGGQLLPNQLESLPGLTDNPGAMSIAQTMYTIFGQAGAIPTSGGTPPMPTGQGAPLSPALAAQLSAQSSGTPAKTSFTNYGL